MRAGVTRGRGTQGRQRRRERLYARRASPPDSPVLPSNSSQSEGRYHCSGTLWHEREEVSPGRQAGRDAGQPLSCTESPPAAEGASPTLLPRLPEHRGPPAHSPATARC